MALDIQYVSLDISKRPTPQQVRLGQGDANGTQLVVSIFDGGTAYSLANKSVRLALRLPSNDAYYEVSGTASNNTATFNIDETYAASSHGSDGFGYVDVMSGSTVICSTSRFQLVVLRSAEDGADPSTSYTSGIIEATEAANDAADLATEKAGLADTAAASANSAASSATSAASSATSAAASATTAAGNANTAAQTATTAAALITDKPDAVLQGTAGGTSLQTVTDAWQTEPKGAALYGKSVQDGTPTPSAPVPVQVVGGRNLVFKRIEHASVDPNGIIIVNNAIDLLVAKVDNGGVYTVTQDWGNLVCGFYATEPVMDAVSYNSSRTQQSAQTITAPINGYIAVWTKTGYQGQIEAGTTATPYVPYGSIGLSVQGKNLLDAQESYTGSVTSAYYTDFIATGSSNRTIGTVHLVAGTTYTLSADIESSVGNFNFSVGTGSGTYAADIATRFGLSNGRISVTFTPSQSTLTQYGDIFAFRVPRYSTQRNFSYKVSNIQLEISSTATDYQPYHSEFAYIDLQGNVLASLPDGTRDALAIDSAGHVTLAKNVGRVVFDGTENWTAHSSVSNVYYIDQPQFIGIPTASQTGYALSNRYPFVPASGAANMQNNTFFINTSSRLFVRNDAITTLENFKADFASNGMIVFGKLATPQTIDLGTITLPEMAQSCEVAFVTTLDPEWAITYERDPNVVISRIESSIAPIEGKTASANYSVGSYLIHGDRLYRVTSAIATGEAITPGTNCVACTVMAELIRLTA